MKTKKHSQLSTYHSQFKMTEVGMIPEDWEVSELKDTARVVDSLHQTPSFTNDGYSMVRVADIKTGNLNLNSTLKVCETVFLEFTKNYKPERGDIVLSRVGSYGVSSFVETNEPFCMGQNTVVLQAKLPARYLYFSLNSRSTRLQIEDGSYGSGYKSLSLKNIKELLIPLPPTKAEQEAIAEALSDVDALIESLEQLITKKRQIKQGAMQALLTGKKRLPGFSGEWKVRTLGEIFSFGGGLTASRDQLSFEGHCYLHYGDIHTSKRTFIDVGPEYQNIPKLDIPLKKVSPVSLLEDGDVVFVDASEDDEGASKHVVVINPDGIPFISGLHTIVAKCKANTVDHKYRRFCFQTTATKAQFRFFAVGTKVSGISKANIAKINLPVPPLPEQEAVATILSDMDEDIAAIGQKLTKARQIKQGMMQELLTGRVRLIN